LKINGQKLKTKARKSLTFQFCLLPFAFAFCFLLLVFIRHAPTKFAPTMVLASNPAFLF